MAIERTVFGASSFYASITEVSQWLSDNAEDYFTRIETSSNLINCYIGDTLALTLFGTTNNGYQLGTIYAGSSSKGLYFRNDYLVNESDCVYSYAYKTSHGICLIPKDPSGAYAMYGVFIGKAPDGAVIIAICGNNGTGSRTPQVITSDPENAGSLTSSSSTGSNDAGYLNMQFAGAGLTTFCNVCTNTGKYAEGLYYMPFSEISGIVTTITDGKKKYVTNGVFALEE
jgi:hypothetical protein